MANKVLNGETYLCASPYVVVKKAANRRMMFCRHIVEILLLHCTSEILKACYLLGKKSQQLTDLLSSTLETEQTI